MSYGTPALATESRSYRVVLNHDSITGSGDLVAVLSFGDAAEIDTDQVVQDFVDLVDSSADFVIAEAKKSTPSIQIVTPT